MSQRGMDISAVDGYVQTLSQGANNLDSLTTQVSGLESPLESVWEGVEAEACVELLTILASKMQEMSIEVMKIHDWVVQTKDNYEEAANKGASAYMG